MGSVADPGCHLSMEETAGAAPVAVTAVAAVAAVEAVTAVAAVEAVTAVAAVQHQLLKVHLAVTWSVKDHSATEAAPAPAAALRQPSLLQAASPAATAQIHHLGQRTVCASAARFSCLPRSS